MKEKLNSVKQALEWTRDMWAWLAKNPGAQKERWPGWLVREDCWSHCACCAVTRPNVFGCEKCPMRSFWQKDTDPLVAQRSLERGNYPCVDLKESLYFLWTVGLLDAEEKAAIAQQISDAAAKAVEEWES